jgi:plastocyanin
LRKLLLLASVLVIAAAVAIPAIAATTKTTTLKDDFFTKSKLTIAKGTTVVWNWKATRHKHTVSDYEGRWSSKEKRKGSYKHTFKKKGTFTVYCLVHPIDMRQRIVVK